MKTLRKILLHGFLIISSLVALFPFYYMFITAFKTNAEFYQNPFGLPHSPTLENIYNLIIERQFYRYFFNTVALTFLSTTIVIVLSVFPALAYAKMNFRGKEFLFNITIAMTSIPLITIIIPLYSSFARLNLLNKIEFVSLVYAGLMVPFTVFCLTSFFKSIPDDIFSAAKIDGCSEFMIVFKIVMPLSKPALVTLFIANGLWVWNELLLALLFLQEPMKRTIVVMLSSLQGRFTMNQPLVMAGALFVGVPMIIIYLLGQKYFVKGLTSGAVK